ncbi:MAG: cobalt-precorrin-5B (C(1))-methyltransferase [Thermodesulfobacteria bacterium]|nr:cobalt-precorrin-5B (C(1))-methyltransferase [Thermodesulfobacteriota bacterium]
MKSPKKRLREGFSTGACAAAAAKAATIFLTRGEKPSKVELNFPDGVRRSLAIEWIKGLSPACAKACVIKDAGDDPDVTHGAQIEATVEISDAATSGEERVEILGGKGVGRVTKPGLAVKKGEPAINPVPRTMITHAVLSALGSSNKRACVTISVPEGERLAEKTLNKRLGIVGGISILGTTGIVKPISEAAWCATISVSMDVALAVGLDTICLSTGRSSEEAAMKAFPMKEEAFISMGDYVGFSLKEAGQRPFRRVILACQWSKLVKMAMGWDQTHVRFGPIDPGDAVKFLEENFGLTLDNKEINTVRQLLSWLQTRTDGQRIIQSVCRHAYTRLKNFLPGEQELKLVLVSYDKRIIHTEP